MKTLNYKYIDNKELVAFIKSNNIVENENILVQIFTGLYKATFIQSLLSNIIQELPHVRIIGSSTCGELIDGQVCDLSTIISFSMFDKTQVVTHSEELLRRVCDRLVIFAKDGAEYFDGGYDLFLEKIGWEEEEAEEKIKVAPKSNNKENKKLKAELVRERNKLTSPLKKKVEKLENTIMQLEEQLEIHHQELIDASNSGDSVTLMELSKTVSDEEKKVEEMFEEFEELSMELEEINEEYETKIEELG